MPPRKSTRSPFGHTFRDPTLLERALTHRSLSYETNPESLTDTQADNEQLEFLGDAILGLIVAEALYRRFPQSREGELTRLRASIVSRKHLGQMAARIDLGAHLRLGRGEERSGGRGKSAILSNALEAVIAAIYLDGGLKPTAAFIEKNILEPALPEITLALATPNGVGSSTFSGAVGDHKSALQEHLQASGLGKPEYVLLSESGPDHQKRFHIQVVVQDSAGNATTLAEADGPTKKAAQQEAARLAFLRILADNPPATASEKLVASA
ncbi:ribonuclease-3 [Granulicella aggregans]|uniref:Ribonuclease 3 n=1 Tax=Granulicella aggregans TaxID=474949 RepID=A0A7W7ZF91_9BACT|nr:ribonuclease III [Granulicella aggregans]MBB5058717.1 ribonuclease-3 [Granulicella aggregans]